MSRNARNNENGKFDKIRVVNKLESKFTLIQDWLNRAFNNCTLLFDNGSRIHELKSSARAYNFEEII